MGARALKALGKHGFSRYFRLSAPAFSRPDKDRSGGDEKICASLNFLCGGAYL